VPFGAGFVPVQVAFPTLDGGYTEDGVVLLVLCGLDFYILSETVDLATRHPDALSGLPPVLIAAFDPSQSRTRYLAMQEVISDLKLKERAEIELALPNTSKTLSSETQGMNFCSIHFDTQDRVWVLAASKNIDRTTLLTRMNALTHGAMAFYQKQGGMFILDLDGVSFELAPFVCLWVRVRHDDVVIRSQPPAPWLHPSSWLPWSVPYNPRDTRYHPNSLW
jgi:hypothetical protein